MSEPLARSPACLIFAGAGLLRVASALAVVMLALAGTPAAAQDTTGVGAISGVVVNAAGQPAEGVRVCALDTSSCATSDARGVFRIGELRAGAYRLEILPLEGLPFTSDPVDVRAGMDGTRGNHAARRRRTSGRRSP